MAAQVSVGGDTLRAHGEFSVPHTAYKIKPVSVPGGTLKLKDELKCSFDILGDQQADLARQEGPRFATEGLWMCLAIPAKIVELTLATRRVALWWKLLGYGGISTPACCRTIRRERRLGAGPRRIRDEQDQRGAGSRPDRMLAMLGENEAALEEVKATA